MQKQKLKLIQGQHFSHGTFFATLSTAQSLYLNAFPNGGSTTHKKFRHYDKNDYSTKNIGDLKAQMQTQLILLRHSLQIFAKQFGIWSFPSNFSKQDFQSQVSEYMNAFRKKNDIQSLELMKNFVQIVLHSNFNNSYIDRAIFKQKKAQNKSQNEINKGVLTGGMKAALQMEQYGKSSQKISKVNQLKGVIYQREQGKKTDRSHKQKQDSAPKQQKNQQKPSELRKEKPISEQLFWTLIIVAVFLFFYGCKKVYS